MTPEQIINVVIAITALLVGIPVAILGLQLFLVLGAIAALASVVFTWILPTGVAWLSQDTAREQQVRIKLEAKRDQRIRGNLQELATVYDPQEQGTPQRVLRDNDGEYYVQDDDGNVVRYPKAPKRVRFVTPTPLSPTFSYDDPELVQDFSEEANSTPCPSPTIRLMEREVKKPERWADQDQYFRYYAPKWLQDMIDKGLEFVGQKRGLTPGEMRRARNEQARMRQAHEHSMFDMHDLRDTLEQPTTDCIARSTSSARSSSTRSATSSSSNSTMMRATQTRNQHPSPKLDSGPLSERQFN